MDWKREIIEMTQSKAARREKIDATFFPPLPLSEIEEWERANAVCLPGEWRSFYLQSDGMEAQKGTLHPLLPLNQCRVVAGDEVGEGPWIEFGRSPTHRYGVGSGRAPAVFRREIDGTGREDFASSLSGYLEAVFAGRV